MMSNQWNETEQLIMGLFSAIAIVLSVGAGIGFLYVVGHIIVMAIRNAA